MGFEEVESWFKRNVRPGLDEILKGWQKIHASPPDSRPYSFHSVTAGEPDPSSPERLIFKEKLYSLKKVVLGPEAAGPKEGEGTPIPVLAKGVEFDPARGLVRYPMITVAGIDYVQKDRIADCRSSLEVPPPGSADRWPEEIVLEGREYLRADLALGAGRGGSTAR